MNLLTIITAAFLLIVIIRACMRGFLKTLFSMMFLVMVILTTMMFTPRMTKLFRESENLQAYFHAKSTEYIERGGGHTSIGRNASAGDVAAAVTDLALGLAGMRSIDADQMTDYLMSLAATVTTFILSCIVWLLIEIVVGRFRKHKAVKMADHIMGIPLGALRGILIVWVGLGAISLLSFTRVGVSLAEQVQASPFLRFLYENNLLAQGIKDMITRSL